MAQPIIKYTNTQLYALYESLAEQPNELQKVLAQIQENMKELQSFYFLQTVQLENFNKELINQNNKNLKQQNQARMVLKAANSKEFQQNQYEVIDRFNLEQYDEKMGEEEEKQMVIEFEKLTGIKYTFDQKILQEKKEMKQLEERYQQSLKNQNHLDPYYDTLNQILFQQQQQKKQNLTLKLYLNKTKINREQYQIEDYKQIHKEQDNHRFKITSEMNLLRTEIFNLQQEIQDTECQNDYLKVQINNLNIHKLKVIHQAEIEHQKSIDKHELVQQKQIKNKIKEVYRPWRQLNVNQESMIQMNNISQQLKQQLVRKQQDVLRLKIGDEVLKREIYQILQQHARSAGHFCEEVAKNQKLTEVFQFLVCHYYNQVVDYFNQLNEVFITQGNQPLTINANYQKDQKNIMQSRKRQRLQQYVDQIKDQQNSNQSSKITNQNDDK